MRTKYIITTISNDVINVSRETFIDYIKELNVSHPEWDDKTFEHDLEHYKLTQRAYFITVNGERKVACQIDTWEDK